MRDEPGRVSSAAQRSTTTPLHSTTKSAGLFEHSVKRPLGRPSRKAHPDSNLQKLPRTILPVGVRDRQTSSLPLTVFVLGVRAAQPRRTIRSQRDTSNQNTLRVPGTKECSFCKNKWVAPSWAIWRSWYSCVAMFLRALTNGATIVFVAQPIRIRRATGWPGGLHETSGQRWHVREGVGHAG